MVVNPIVAKLKEKSVRNVNFDDPDLGKFTFKIRSISTIELLEYSDLLADVAESGGVNPELITKESKLDAKQIKSSAKAVLPMMKNLIPKCCIDPKVTNDFSDPDMLNEGGNTIHMSQIPLRILSELFNQILDVSGLGKEAAELKKKSLEQTSPKP